MTRVSAPTLPLPLFRTGKVRDMYAVGDDRLLMLASDRVSAFDVVMDELVPGKGAVLTELSAFWFRKTADLVPNHLISDRVEDLPAEVQDDAASMRGRWLLVRRAERIDIECVVRGYISGSAWAEYRRLGTVAGEPLSANLVESQRLARPIFTPAIKAESGHDENISRARLARMLGPERAQLLERLSLRLYEAGAEHALSRGLILADTKFEFGMLDGEILLIDEALTPDSSRYWPADQYRPGRASAELRQTVPARLPGRQWLEQTAATAAASATGHRWHGRAVRGSASEVDGVSGEPANGLDAQPLAEWAAEIRVLLKPSVNDPQGLSIRNALRTLGFSGVEDVRAGKLIQVRLMASDRHAAEEAIERMGAQLLANPVIETFSFTLDELPARVP